MVKQRAKFFKKTRQQHLTESAEDYTELVMDLIEELGEARVTELARRLGVSHVTALKTAARLKKIGLLSGASRSPITLTKQGTLVAKKSRKRHQIVVNFLVTLGVSKRTAETDAEGIEHHLSQETLKIMGNFTQPELVVQRDVSR